MTATGTVWMVIIHTAEMRPFPDDSPQSKHLSIISVSFLGSQTSEAELQYLGSDLPGFTLCRWGSSCDTCDTEEDPTQKSWPRGISRWPLGSGWDDISVPVSCGSRIWWESQPLMRLRWSHSLVALLGDSSQTNMTEGITWGWNHPLVAQQPNSAADLYQCRYMLVGGFNTSEKY